MMHEYYFREGRVNDYVWHLGLLVEDSHQGVNESAGALLIAELVLAGLIEDLDYNHFT